MTAWMIMQVLQDQFGLSRSAKTALRYPSARHAEVVTQEPQSTGKCASPWCFGEDVLRLMPTDRFS